MKKISTLMLAFAVSFSLFAQPKANYYTAATGQKGYALKTALSAIVGPHTDRGYSAVWTAYYTTDKRPDGTVWDIYSNATRYRFGTDQAGTYSKEGDKYNREHSFPKSWFNDGKPMYNDVHHLYPSDGYVNGRRGNYPFGEVGSASYTSNNGFCKLGSCKTPGYSGTVFEPNDEFKGDLARTYFYMATAYEDKIAGWSSPMLSNNKNSAYKDWALQMLLRWAANDPVSQKEIDRNNAIEKFQGNRNPFIDFPGLEQYIWGNKKEVAFDPVNYQKEEVTPDPQPQPDPTPEPEPEPDPIVPGEQNVFVAVSSTSELKVGESYLIVCESKGTAMGASDAQNNYRTSTSVDLGATSLSTEVNTSGKPYLITLGGAPDAYTLYDAITDVYLGFTGSNNRLYVYEAEAESCLWTININSAQEATISPKAVPSRAIRYNISAPRFACYTTGTQTAVKIYKLSVPTAITPIPSQSTHIDVYNLNGQVVRRRYPANDLQRLPAGFYIVKGQKILVK